MDKLLHSAQTDRTSKNNKKALSTKKDQFFEISEAVYVAEYKIQIFFTNGQVRVVDFKPFLITSKNSQIRQYLELNKFSQFRIIYGDLVWNDYELCFPVSDLYEGRI